MPDDALHALCLGTDVTFGSVAASPEVCPGDRPPGSPRTPPEPPPQTAALPPPARASLAHRLPPPVDSFLHRQLQQQIEQLADAEPPERDQHARGFVLFHAMPGWLFSTVVHLLVFLTLSVYVHPDPDRGAKYVSLRAVDAPDDAPPEAFEEPILEAPPAPGEAHLELAPDPSLLDHAMLAAPEIAPPEVVLPEPETPVPLPEPETQASETRRGLQPGFQVGGDDDGGLAGRGDRRRQALTQGATVESENAVEAALQWLVRHQRLDGSWNFHHQLGEHHCAGCQCGNPGAYLDDENGATGMVLLALLGAGHTHLRGEYREEVAAGLRYLIDHQETNGSLRDPSGRMYSHGLATLALCEALAMTRGRDPRSGSAVPRWEARSVSPSDDRGAESAEQGRLADGDLLAAASAGSALFGAAMDTPVPVTQAELSRAAQYAVMFIEAAQHAGGGWRYQPREAGDTSVVGWQLMALKSAYLAGLEVNPRTLNRTIKFLDFVSEDRLGSCYGYTHGRKTSYLDVNFPIKATTPIGLLCRMYTGWEHKRPALALGAERLLVHARPKMGLYHYYYATQVMHHYGGQPWEIWNKWMRDYLVQSQSQTGSELGSWYLDGPFDDAGRLYCTALAAMTLEVYYRYSNLYSKESVAAAPRDARSRRHGAAEPEAAADP